MHVRRRVAVARSRCCDGAQVLVRALKTLEAALYCVTERKTFDVFELTKEVGYRDFVSRLASD